MGNDIEPVRNYVEGESLDLTFPVRDPDESVHRVDGASIDWYLLANKNTTTDNAMLDDSDDGVSTTVRNASYGLLALVIEKGVTDGMAGDYVQRVDIDLPNEGRQKYSGSFVIEEI